MANDQSPHPRHDASATGTVLVHLPAVLVRLFPEAQREVRVSASTVAALADALDARWPGMRDSICDSTPAIRRHINVFVDGRRTVLDDAVSPGAEVYIFTAMSGG
jgi:molybdopterin synthase sulfur carrier subunit